MGNHSRCSDSILKAVRLHKSFAASGNGISFDKGKTSLRSGGSPASLIHMHNLGRRETIERRAAGGGIGADVFGVEQIAHIQIRELRGQGDGIEGIARRAEDGADLSGTFLETSHAVLAVVKDLAAVGVIDAVVDVVTEFAFAERPCR